MSQLACRPPDLTHNAAAAAESSAVGPGACRRPESKPASIAQACGVVTVATEATGRDDLLNYRDHGSEQPC